MHIFQGDQKYSWSLDYSQLITVYHSHAVIQKTVVKGNKWETDWELIDNHWCYLNY